jgi:hypothetical protein
MSIILIASLSIKSLILLYSIKPFTIDLIPDEFSHTLGLMGFLALDIVVGFLSIKNELRMKYNSLSTALRLIEPKTEQETMYIKNRTDLIYIDSLRNSLVSCYKVVFTFLILCLLTTLISKQLVLSEDDFKERATAVLFPMFYSVRRNYYRLFNWYMGFGVWQTAFGLCVGNIALIVLAPAYFDQLITLGVLFQVLNAFGRVESSMGYFIDRWTTIVDFLSVIRRLREFNKALDSAEDVTYDDEGKQV